jgi:hypothetical protein
MTGLSRWGLVALLCVAAPSGAGAAPYDPDILATWPVPPAVSSALAAQPLLQNGSFESNGGVGSNSFTGWTVQDSVPISGSWIAQKGTVVPFLGFPFPPPPNGAFAAVSAQEGPGTHLLFQDVIIPTGGATLRCQVFVANSTTDFIVPNPETLDPFGPPNQHARIDVMDPSAPADDVGAGVLLNVFITNPGDAGSASNPMTAYQMVTASLDAFAGQTVRLRFAEVDNQLFFQFAVDGCSILGRGAAVPALGQSALFALVLALLMLGMRRLALSSTISFLRPPGIGQQ